MIRLDALRVKWDIDECPDLSWLETKLSEDGKRIMSSMRYEQDELNQHPIRTKRYIKQDHERLNSYGDNWVMMGCIAEAETSYPLNNNGDRRIERLTSGGLWGIESDSNDEHKTSIAWQELDDLKAHLEKFNVALPEDWDDCMHDAITKMDNTETRRDSILSPWVEIDWT